MAVATRTPTVVACGPWVSPRRHPSSAAPEPRWVDEPEPDAREEHDESAAAGIAIPPRYRPGRGGFDPDADAKSARSRYAFRQRAVLALLLARWRTASPRPSGSPRSGGPTVAWMSCSWSTSSTCAVRSAWRWRSGAGAPPALPATAAPRATSACSTSGLDGTRRRPHRRSSGRAPLRPRLPSRTPTRCTTSTTRTTTRTPTGLTRMAMPHAFGASASRSACCRPAVAASTTQSAEPVSALPLLQPAPPPVLPPGAELLAIDDDELDLQDLRPGPPGRSLRRVADIVERRRRTRRAAQGLWRSW